MWFKSSVITDELWTMFVHSSSFLINFLADHCMYTWLICTFTYSVSNRFFDPSWIYTVNEKKKWLWWPCQLHKTIIYMAILVSWDLMPHWLVHTYMGSYPRRFDTCWHYGDNLKFHTIIYTPPLTKTAGNKQLFSFPPLDQNYMFPYNTGTYPPTFPYQDHNLNTHSITFLKTAIFTVIAMRNSNFTRRSNSTL
jgi:hypothetical protein